MPFAKPDKLSVVNLFALSIALSNTRVPFSDVTVTANFPLIMSFNCNVTKPFLDGLGYVANRCDGCTNCALEIDCACGDEPGKSKTAKPLLGIPFKRVK